MQAKAQNNMATVAKTQTKKKKKSVISANNRKKIVAAYYQMYKAFLLRNLVSGMTLGAAAHNALQLLRAKLSTMDKTNPVTRFLLRIHTAHSKRVARFVMTSPHRNAIAVISPEQRAKVSAKIAALFKSATTVFNNMSAMYKPQQKQNAKPMPQIKNPVLQVLVFKRNQRQRMAA